MGVGRPQPMHLDMEVEEQLVLGRLNRHIIPWLFSLAMICYLDRTNLSFGALELNRDLKFDCATYGFGAGIFFIGYALFQLPLTLAPQRFGAPTWLFAVCTLWSCVTVVQAAVRGPMSFYILRFLLGVAESSTFPTMYYLLSLFYSPAEMSMAYSRVATGNSVAHVVGGPLAAAVLHLDGMWGIRGWQWLFITGGSMTLVFAFVMRLFLAGEPRTAWFLTPAEREWLHDRQVASSQAGGAGKTSKFRAILDVARDWRVLYLAVVWMLTASAIFGIMFWAPLLIASMFGGGSGSAPPAPASPASDGGDKICSQGGVFLASTMLVAAHLGPAAGFVCLIIAAACTWAFHGPFFTWPSVFLKGGASAAAFALINSFGSVGGFIGPSLIGAVSHVTGSYGAAMAALGAMLALSGAALMAFPVAGANDVRVDVVDLEESAALNDGDAAAGLAQEEIGPDASGHLHPGSWNGGGAAVKADGALASGDRPAALGPRTRSGSSFRSL